MTVDWINAQNNRYTIVWIEKKLAPHGSNPTKINESDAKVLLQKAGL